MNIKLTEEQKEILKGKICPYCHIPTEYKNSIDIYGIDYGMIYYCPKCQAYVGVHKGTDQAKGRLANAELRKCKIEAHRYFDKIFKRGIMKRTDAYQWLSEQLGLPPEYTHIGMFNPETCRKVVELSKQYLNTMRWALRNQDKIKEHFEPDGDEMLERLKKSLRNAFSTYENIEECIKDWENEPYPVLCIEDAGHTFNMVAFYVIRKQYDVYTLAFKEFIG